MPNLDKKHRDLIKEDGTINRNRFPELHGIIDSNEKDLYRVRDRRVSHFYDQGKILKDELENQG